MRYSYAATVEAANFPLFFKVAEETYVLKVDLVEAHRPGTIAFPGVAVSEADEMNPMNLVVAVNDDNDDGGPMGWRDNADATIGSNDNDIVTVTLASPGMSAGTMEFTVTPASMVHVFVPDILPGTTRFLNCPYYVASDSLVCSVNFASPTGDLAGIATGTSGVTLYLEGMVPVADVALTLVYRNTTGTEVARDEAHLAVANVRVLAADICANTITSTLAPSGIAGNFQLELVGPASPQGTQFFSMVRRGSGTYTDVFQVQTMPVGSFSSIRATWTVAGQSFATVYPYSFQNLGQYLHSQYNTPNEGNTTCGGNAVDACFTTPGCDYAQGTLHSTFLAATNLNGSGRSIDHGVILPEAYCQTHGYPPPAGCQGIDVFRENATIATSCGTTVSNATVARNPSHPFLTCGDRVCLSGAGPNGTGVVKTVTDRCPGCSVEQLDNYTDDGRCSGIPHLGNFVTIKLLETL